MPWSLRTFFPDRCWCGCAGTCWRLPAAPRAWSSAEAAGISGFHSWQKFGPGDLRCRPQEAPHPEVASTQFDPKTAGQVPHPSDEGREGSFRNRSADRCGIEKHELADDAGIRASRAVLVRAFKKPHSLAFETDRPAVAFPRSGRGVRKFAPSMELREADSPVPDELVRQVSSCVTRASHRTRGIHELGAQMAGSPSPTPPPRSLGDTPWKALSLAPGLQAPLGMGSCPGEVKGPARHRVIARVPLTRSLTRCCIPPVLTYNRGKSHRI